MSTVEVSFNPFDPSFAADPYAQWSLLREHDPVHETPVGFWLLLRHRDIQSFLRDPALSVEERNADNGLLDAIAEAALGDRYADMQNRGSRAMLNVDPPDHTRLRRLVSKAFTPRRIELLRPRIQELVDGYLDGMAERGRAELIGDLAFPLPFAVITELLGMPDTDTAQLREWSGTVVRSLEPLADPDLIRAIADAGDHMRALCAEAVEAKRRHPADDLLSGLIAAEEAGDVLADDELYEQVMLLYIAGHETTVNLIGNGMLALVRHPDQLARFASDGDLEANAVEELLRFDPPVQMTRRITLTDVEVGGKTIPSGTFVACVLASANRDREQWGPDADRLVLSRPGAQNHLAFGGGTHFCLGAALARLEARVALGTMVRRFTRIEPAGDPEWNGRLNLRGLDRLPLTVGEG